MSICTVFARWAIRTAAAAVFVWGSWAPAADVTAPPPVIPTAPVAVGAADPGCATCQTCQHGLAKGSCTTCGKLFTGHRDKKAPYPVTLCPGACFGYFQTQWRKWDEVCPYPYLGVGVGDASKGPPSMMRPAPGGELPPPRTLDPKMQDPKKLGSNTPLYPGVPPIPTVAIPVPDKFAP